MKKKSPTFSIFLLLLFLIVSGLSYILLFADNIIDEPSSGKRIIYIHTGSGFRDILDSLGQGHILKSIKSFAWVAEKLHYNERIMPGRYVVSNNSGNLILILRLRSGRQDPVKITFNNVQNKEELADKISGKLEASRKDILKEFNDHRFLDSLHLTEANFPTIFLANSYEFYWNTSARQFIERMLKEYNKFWTEDKKAKGKALGLSPTEITILASIVQKESNHYDEYPVIAGVYINRLRKGIALQADPTVMYALNELGIRRRVYKNDLKIQSPFNTYLYRGLPPGPICLPELKTIEQTLAAQNHNYMYFCARDDFSGYHAFAATWEQHLENARRYQKALNDHNIH